MKKILVFIVAFAMLFSFAACSSEEGGNNGETVDVVPERGNVENGTYKNSAFGIVFEATEDWYFLTDDEIASVMGVTAEEIYGEGTVIEGDHIYDLYCVDNATNATVSVNYENLGTLGEMTDANYYLETVMTQVLSTGAQSGVVDAIISNVTISGIEVPCLEIVLEYGEQTIYEKMIVKQTGTWMGTVTVASLSQTELADLVEKISFE